MQYAYSHNNVHSYIQQILLPPMHHCTTLIRCGKEPHTHAQHDRCSEAVMCWDVGHPALSCMVSPNIFFVYISMAISLWSMLISLVADHFHCMCTTPQTPTFVSDAFKLVVAGRQGRGPCMHSKAPTYIKYMHMKAESIEF